MRLLVVSQYFWPENFRINDLVEELTKRGHEVIVLTGLPNYPDGKVFQEFRDDSRKFDAFCGARIIRVPIVPRGKNAIQLLLNYASYCLLAGVVGWWRLRRVAIDAIFVFEPSPITVGIPAALLRKIKRAPVAFWVLDLWPETLHAVGVVRSKFLLGLIGQLVRFIYSQCDLILAQSKSFMTHIRRHAADDGQIRYFPSWADAVFSPADATSPAPELSNVDHPFKILFAGNIGDAQDFPAILDAAESLKDRTDIGWYIVGDGRQADWVRAQVATRGVGDTVRLLGRFPVERMPSFYAASTALLVTLRSDPVFSMTIPGKLQSYLSAGKPILAMLDGEGALAITSAGCGLASPAGDSVALARAVVELCNLTEKQRHEMGARALSYSTAHFDRATLIDQLEAWLKAMTARGVNGSR